MNQIRSQQQACSLAFAASQPFMENACKYMLSEGWVGAERSHLQLTRPFKKKSMNAIHLEPLLVVQKFQVKIVREKYRVFFRTENRNGLSCIIKKTGKFLPFFRKKSLALVIQTNGTEISGRFGKSGKKVITRKVSPFFLNHSIGINRSTFDFFPELPDFSYKW